MASEMLAHMIWQGLEVCLRMGLVLLHFCHPPKKDMLWLAFWSKEENEKCMA